MILTYSLGQQCIVMRPHGDHCFMFLYSPPKLGGAPLVGEGVCKYTNQTHSSGLRPPPLT